MTGHEFAAAHGNDSSNWTSADFETELVLAENDALPAYRFIQQRRTKAAPALTDFADKPGTPDPCQEADLLPSLQPATRRNA